MGCGISATTDQIDKNKKGTRVVQQLFAELQDEEDDGAIYRGEVLISVKYKREDELVLIRLMKGYSLLSRDGQIHSCNPYVKMELQYNEEVIKPAAGENCSSTDPENAYFTPKVETSLNAKRHKFTRSISLLHDYEQFKCNQLKNTDHRNDIDKLDLAQARPRVHEQCDKTDDSLSPSSPLSFKHEISTTAQSKVVWHTRNPEFNELFLFRVTKEKLTSAFLLVSVMDREILTKDTCIGYATIQLGTLSITGVQSIPPQWFTIKKSRNKDPFETDPERDRVRQQRMIRSQEFREAMLAHSSLQGLVMAKGMKNPNKTKVYRLTSVKHQQHARVVM